MVVALGLVFMAASATSGQTVDGGPDPETVRMRIGPLWMNPIISMPNLGIDTNVFNDPPSADPKSDFTLTLAPKADMWLRLGRTWLSGTVAEDLIWFQTYSTESSVNQLYSIGWKAPLNRLVLGTSATWVRTSSRPGFEIDTRAQRDVPTYTASAEIRGFSRTFIGVRGSWAQVAFDEDAEFNGSNLQEQLDRTTNAAAVTVRHAVTPLTSIIFSAGRSEERFKTASTRDSTSDDYSVAVEFDPAALLKGSARVGYTAYTDRRGRSRRLQRDDVGGQPVLYAPRFDAGCRSASGAAFSPRTTSISLTTCRPARVCRWRSRFLVPSMSSPDLVDSGWNTGRGPASKWQPRIAPITRERSEAVSDTGWLRT